MNGPTLSPPRKNAAGPSLYHSMDDPELTASSRYGGKNGMRNNPPTAQVLAESYLNDEGLLKRGGQGEHSRYNPLNPSRPRSSVLLNTNDPVAMHLLIETAIFDSHEYEILSFEEIEELKKEYSFLSNRIDACKRKLALESKVREAALSISRLYQNKKGPKRRSLLGGGSQIQDVNKQTDDELIASNRKCEDLAMELWRLENRAVEIQRRLLQHSAGILGMTYGGPMRKKAMAKPASQFSSYSQDRGVSISTPDEFDDRSLYRTVDKLDDLGFDKSDTAKDSTNVEHGRNAGTFDEQTLNSVRQKFDQLEQQLSTTFSLPRTSTANTGKQFDKSASENAANELLGRLDSIGQTISSLESFSNNAKSDSERVRQMDNAMRTGWESIRTNEEMREVSSGIDDEDASLLPQLQEFSLEEFSAVLNKIISGAQKLRSDKASLGSQIESLRLERADQEVKVKQITHGLNEMANSVEELTALLEQRQKDLSAAQKSIANLNDDLVGIQAELAGSKQETRTARDELTTVMKSLDLARKEIQMKDQQRFASESEALNTEKRARAAMEQSLRGQLDEKEAVLSKLRAEHSLLVERNAFSASNSESLLKDHEKSLQEQRDEILALQKAKSMSNDARESAERSVKEAQDALQQKSTELSKTETEMRDLEMDMVRLNTDVAMLKAQLDEAHGSRSQRQAEAAEAARQAASKGSSEREQALERRCSILQKELTEMMNDYETLTKASIDFENDRTNLETFVDKLRDRVEELETQVADEKVRWLGVKTSSFGPDGKSGTPISGDGPLPGDSTSTAVLRTEFKKMMRDMRAEAQKSLKAEQEERKRLELQVRSMKKDLQQRS